MKLKLTHQIFALFSFVIVLSFLVFTFIVNVRLNENYNKLTLSGMMDFVNYTEGLWQNGSEINGTKYDFIIGSFISDDVFKVTGVSENAKDLVDETTIKNVLTTYLSSSSVGNNYSFITKGIEGRIYVSVKVNKNGRFILALCGFETTDASINQDFGRFILIFAVIILWGFAIILIWSQQLVSRLKQIQKTVTLLPSSNYQTRIKVEGEDEISELASSIEGMRREIIKNDETKKEIIQNVSHDIKTPIAVIKSYAEAICDGVEGRDGAKVILKQAAILTKKSEQLLQYNKLEYLETQKDFTDVNMKELIENLLDSYRFQTNVNFDVNLENVYFKGFQENYYTVITNLIDNGIRYAKTVIRLTLKENYLEIYNDGEQIDPAFIPNMFKAYEKGNKGKFGLGMSIVKRTLDHFGYSIVAQNEEIGVSFIIQKK